MSRRNNYKNFFASDSEEDADDDVLAEDGGGGGKAASNNDNYLVELGSDATEDEEEAIDDDDDDDEDFIISSARKKKKGKKGKKWSKAKKGYGSASGPKKKSKAKKHGTPSKFAIFDFSEDQDDPPSSSQSSNPVGQAPFTFKGKNKASGRPSSSQDDMNLRSSSSSQREKASSETAADAAGPAVITSASASSPRRPATTIPTRSTSARAQAPHAGAPPPSAPTDNSNGGRADFRYWLPGRHRGQPIIAAAAAVCNRIKDSVDRRRRRSRQSEDGPAAVAADGSDTVLRDGVGGDTVSMSESEKEKEDAKLTQLPKWLVELWMWITVDFVVYEKDEEGLKRFVRDTFPLGPPLEEGDEPSAGSVPRQESRVYVLHIVSILREVMQDVPRDKLQVKDFLDANRPMLNSMCGPGTKLTEAEVRAVRYLWEFVMGPNVPFPKHKSSENPQQGLTAAQDQHQSAPSDNYARGMDQDDSASRAEDVNGAADAGRNLTVEYEDAGDDVQSEDAGDDVQSVKSVPTTVCAEDAEGLCHSPRVLGSQPPATPATGVVDEKAGQTLSGAELADMVQQHQQQDHGAGQQDDEGTWGWTPEAEEELQRLLMDHTSNPTTEIPQETERDKRKREEEEEGPSSAAEDRDETHLVHEPLSKVARVEGATLGDATKLLGGSSQGGMEECSVKDSGAHPVGQADLTTHVDMEEECAHIEDDRRTPMTVEQEHEIAPKQAHEDLTTAMAQVLPGGVEGEKMDSSQGVPLAEMETMRAAVKKLLQQAVTAGKAHAADYAPPVSLDQDRAVQTMEGTHPSIASAKAELWHVFRGSQSKPMPAQWCEVIDALATLSEDASNDWLEKVADEIVEIHTTLKMTPPVSTWASAEAAKDGAERDLVVVNAADELDADARSRQLEQANATQEHVCVSLVEKYVRVKEDMVAMQRYGDEYIERCGRLVDAKAQWVTEWSKKLDDVRKPELDARAERLALDQQIEALVAPHLSAAASTESQPWVLGIISNVLDLAHDDQTQNLFMQRKSVAERLVLLEHERASIAGRLRLFEALAAVVLTLLTEAKETTAREIKSLMERGEAECTQVVSRLGHEVEQGAKTLHDVVKDRRRRVDMASAEVQRPRQALDKHIATFGRVERFTNTLARLEAEISEYEHEIRISQRVIDSAQHNRGDFFKRCSQDISAEVADQLQSAHDDALKEPQTCMLM